MDKSKTNSEVIQRYFDAYNKRDESILDEIIADDYVDYGHQPPGRGAEGAKNDYRAVATGFQDGRFEIDDLIVTDDRAVARWTVRGTHTGSFAGIAPTQKKVEMRGISLYKLRDGKITETRNLADLLGLFTQLGAIEMPKAAA